MASRVGPRSVADATRFTASAPHAASKASGTSVFPGRGRVAAGGPRQPSRIPGETPEQRVKRLREAHLAAQRAQTSQLDRFIDGSRRYLDLAHRWTVRGIVLFTAVAGIVSAYSVWDMVQFNRARRAEWIEAQKKFESDALATARIAYIKNEATPEQVALVEEANRLAAEQGLRLAPLLAPPEHRTHFEENVTPLLTGAQVGAVEGRGPQESATDGRGILGLAGRLLAGGSASEKSTTDKEGSSVASVSLSETGKDAVRAVDAQAGALQDRAREAWERERENQRKGGSLDQLGLQKDASSGQEPAKKSWRLF